MDRHSTWYINIIIMLIFFCLLCLNSRTVIETTWKVIRARIIQDKILRHCSGCTHYYMNRTNKFILWTLSDANHTFIKINNIFWIEFLQFEDDSSSIFPFETEIYLVDWRCHSNNLSNPNSKFYIVFNMQSVWTIQQQSMLANRDQKSFHLHFMKKFLLDIHGFNPIENNGNIWFFTLNKISSVIPCQLKVR